MVFITKRQLREYAKWKADEEASRQFQTMEDLHSSGFTVSVDYPKKEEGKPDFDNMKKIEIIEDEKK